MPVYFFHLRSKDLLLEDCEGTDLPNLHAALEQILRAKRELAADLDDSGDGLAFEVTDSNERLLLKVPVNTGWHGSPPAPQRHPKIHAGRSSEPAIQRS